MVRQEVWLKDKQIARVIDVKSKKNVKHVKVLAARGQRILYDGLTLYEAGFLFKLLPYMNWEANMIVGDARIGPKDEPLKWAQLDKILLCSKPHRIRLAKSLEAKNVIRYREENGKRIGIVINPKYALCGYKASKELLELFNDVYLEAAKAENTE